MALWLHQAELEIRYKAGRCTAASQMQRAVPVPPPGAPTAIEIRQSGHKKEVGLPAGQADPARLQGHAGATVAHKAGTHPCSHSSVDPAPTRSEQLVQLQPHHGFSVLTDQSL